MRFKSTVLRIGFLWFSSALLALATFGQSTTVSGTITDAGSQAWANGTYRFDFPNPSQVSWTGGTITTPLIGSLDGSGHYSVSVPSNSAITPSGTQWTLTLCPQANSQCYSSQFTITGATQTVAPTPPAISVSVSPNVLVSAYSSNEVTGAVIGSSYYDLTASAIKVCTALTAGACSTWSSSGGGGIPYPSAGVPVSTGSAWSTSLPVQSIAPNQDTWYVSRNCGLQTNCTQIYGDTKYVVDATSTSTTTVTCPNSDCNFVAGDVGKKVWATTQGTGAGVGYLIYTTYVCPVTTIATVNSAQSITLNTTCTASGSANVVLIWGHDDGTALASLDTASGCSSAYLPDTQGGFIMDSKPFYVNAPTCGVSNALALSVGPPAPTLQGPGFGESEAVIVITPDFAWASCKAVTGSSQNDCFGGTLRAAANIQFWGTGLTSATNANCANGGSKNFFAAPSAVIYGVDLAGICPGESGLTGVELDGTDEPYDLGGVQEVGTTACSVSNSAKQVSLRGDDCHNIDVSGGIGLNIATGTQAQDFNSFTYTNTVVSGNLQTHNTQFTSSGGTTYAIDVKSGGVWASDGDFVGAVTPSTGYELDVEGGGKAAARNTLFQGNSGVAIAVSSGGAFVDQGGNTVSGSSGVYGSSGQSVSGQQVIGGACTGVVTSLGTVGLYGAGQNALTTCTSTTVTLGQVMTRSGTLHGLNCHAEVAGNQSADKCTVLDNGSATTMTCSLNGVTNCSDGAHSPTYAIGDVISIEVVAGASTTLAGINGTVLAW